MTRSGRPPVALGVWPDMIAAAKGAGGLARILECCPRHLRRTFTGLANLHGPRAVLACLFAEGHGIRARLYVHPRTRGWLLLSMASGWFELPNQPGGWWRKAPCSRRHDEDWSRLGDLELDFSASWDCLAARGDLG